MAERSAAAHDPLREYTRVDGKIGIDTHHSTKVCRVTLELLNPFQRFDSQCRGGLRNRDLSEPLDLRDSAVESRNQFV
jgi:hypothetical protein